MKNMIMTTVTTFGGKEETPSRQDRAKTILKPSVSPPDILSRIAKEKKAFQGQETGSETTDFSRPG